LGAREEIEGLLAKHEFKLTEQASASLLQAAENKQAHIHPYYHSPSFKQ
jgi:hypothetical protein